MKIMDLVMLALGSRLLWLSIGCCIGYWYAVVQAENTKMNF